MPTSESVDHSIPDGKKNSSRRIDPQMITAIALTIISVCALLVSLQQTKILAEQQRVTTEAAKAQLWPHIQLEIHQGFDEAGIVKFELVATNSGTGPAIVEGIRFSFRDSIYTDWWDFLDEIPRGEDVNLGISNDPIGNRVIQAGESFSALVLNDNRPLMRAFIKFFIEGAEQPFIEICYRSVFDDYWLMTKDLFDNYQTQESEGCAIPEDEQFNS